MLKNRDITTFLAVFVGFQGYCLKKNQLSWDFRNV